MSGLKSAFDAALSPSEPGKLGTGGVDVPRGGTVSSSGVGFSLDTEFKSSPPANLGGIKGREASVGVFYSGVDSGLFCCRRVGNSEKFCSRPNEGDLGFCGSIAGHGKLDRLRVRSEHVYVMDESKRTVFCAFLTPELDYIAIPPARREVLISGRRSVSKWRQLFLSLGGVSTVEGFDDVVADVDRPTTFLSTPFKVKPEKRDYVEPEFLGLGEAGSEFASADRSKRPKLNLESLIEEAHLKINALAASVGDYPVGEIPASTLWGSVSTIWRTDSDPIGSDAHLKELQKLQKELKATQFELKKAEASIRALVTDVHEVLPTSLTKFKETVMTMVASAGNDSVPRNHGTSGPSTVEFDPAMITLQEDMRRLRVSSLNQGASLIKLENRMKGEMFEIAGQVFRSKLELTSWVQLHMPDGDVCSIVDAISLLELMGVTKGDFMTNLSIANEVGKTDYTSAHEAAIIESFSIEVPGVFLDGTASRSKDTFDAEALQLLRKYSDWTEHNSSDGIYYRIYDFIESFEERNETNLEVRFAGAPGGPGHRVLSALARDSVSFLRRLIEWVNTYHTETQKSSPAPGEAWSLLRQILHGLFKELKMARNLAGNLSATWKANKVGGCANVLWATFKAHKLMKEFLTYNVSGHPKLAPYVLRFLAKNVATKQSVSSMLSLVEKKADEARKAAKEAQTTADKALSKK